MKITETAEYKRINDAYRAWGPYVSERAWGTAREDYSKDETPWTFFPFEHAACRAYRWGEDGLGGYCDQQQILCMGLALWNGQDALLKERLFGLSNPQGNHGEDVKEYYFYLDGVPSHSYMKMLYKYPQVAFPYQTLVEENKKRTEHEPEYELFDALQEAFEQNRYFDVFIEYAKAEAEEIYCRISVVNRGSEASMIHVLPQLWFRNTWTWNKPSQRPELKGEGDGVQAKEESLGERWWYARAEGMENPRLLFTENETNLETLFGQPNNSSFTKEGIQEAIVNEREEAVNPAQTGTKCAAHFSAEVPPGETFVVQVRLSTKAQNTPFEEFDAVFEQRIQEANEYYATLQPDLSEDEKHIQRAAFAGLLWSKQFYHYEVELALKGEPGLPIQPEQKPERRNQNWRHLKAKDVISIPDKWEYPWFAAWDLEFQTTTLAIIDPHFAKQQLLLLVSERYLNSDGQLPAYEGEFSNANPPVHAWAAWQVYWIEEEVYGVKDRAFLEAVFHKLLSNFSWWFQEKDELGRDIFHGGFLGMDNISVFDRSQPPEGIKRLEQADVVGWMVQYSLIMFCIAFELAQENPVYEAEATRFFRHFKEISQLFENQPRQNLWDERDGFFYDLVHPKEGKPYPIKARSYVGLIPLIAVNVLKAEHLEKFPTLKEEVLSAVPVNKEGNILLSALDREKLERLLVPLFDSRELLSDFGVRSLSRYHAKHPIQFKAEDETNTLRYEPSEAQDDMMGGNSNWRGPIWAPIVQLVIEALYQYDNYYGDALTVQLGGQELTLKEAAKELSRRVICIFLPDEKGKRPLLGQNEYFQTDPLWSDHILFYEHFHGDKGTGLGANHQNGWTSLIAKLIHDSAK